MARKKKQELNIQGLGIRIALSLVVCLAFLLTFFLGGGLYYFENVVAITAFSDLPFEIHFIDVGLGDSIFLRLPNDQTMLVDCGPNKNSNTVVEYLTKLFDYEKIDAIDYFVLSHQDADHVGKGTDIFKTFQVNTVYRPRILSKGEVAKFGNPSGWKTSDTDTYDNVITAAYNEPDCEMIYSEQGIKIYDTDFSVEFLSPAEEKYSNYNNFSPMIMITYRTRKFLLTGDAEEVAEKEVIENHGSGLKADVLKVGHHGSNTSTSLEFLQCVSPAYAVISVNKKNQWNFPKTETLEKLAEVHATVLTTAEKGSIAMSVDDSKAIIIADKNSMIKIDVPLLCVCSGLAIVVIWSIKVKKKKINHLNII